MELDIVKEIITEAKKEIASTLPNFSQLSYEHNIEENNERELCKGYGFIPQNADFKEGSGLGFVTMEHTFQLIVSDTFMNKDDDTSLTNSIFGLYNAVGKVIKDFQKSSLALPTSTYRVLLINGTNIEEPEVNQQNKSVTLRANMIITYKYRKNAF